MQIFKDELLDSTFKKQGYVVYGSIDDRAIKELRTIDEELSIPDYVGCDFNVGMNSDIYDARKVMQEKLSEVLMPYFKEILNDFDFFSASFVNKNPTERFVITAHQDFTYSNEPEIPSFMCWVPLVDTNYENGAIGFIPKSHLFYDYKRAFPFPLEYSPVVQNEIELMKYLNMQEMKAGQMVFFYNNTIHGSFANYTQTIRKAVNISFIKKEATPCLYITDPSAKDRTLLKYQADKNFLIKYNNPSILEMYKKKHIDIQGYTFLGKELFGDYDISWNSINNKLKEFDIALVPKNLLYLKQYNKILRKEKLKNNIYNIFSKVNPFRTKQI